jgi:hypothetical protein
MAGKTHLLLDLDGTLVRRQPIDKKNFVCDPQPLFIDKFRTLVYLRPGLIEFLKWAFDRFEGRVYILTASIQESADEFTKGFRKHFPELPSIRVFSRDDCIWKNKYQIFKDIPRLVFNHPELFTDLETDRWLLVDDMPGKFDDPFTKESSIGVPSFSPVIKVTEGDKLTVFVSESNFVNPSETDYQIIDKLTSRETGFFDQLKARIEEKLIKLPPLMFPQTEFAKGVYGQLVSVMVGNKYVFGDRFIHARNILRFANSAHIPEIRISANGYVLAIWFGYTFLYVSPEGKLYNTHREHAVSNLFDLLQILGIQIESC